MKYLKKNIKYLVLASIFVFIVFMISRYKSGYRKQKLRNTKQTFGIFEGEVVGIGFTGFNYSYTNENGRNYTFIDKTNYGTLKKGDSVLIEYSLDDYEIGRLIRPNYKRK